MKIKLSTLLLCTLILLSVLLIAKYLKNPEQMRGPPNFQEMNQMMQSKYPRLSMPVGGGADSYNGWNANDIDGSGMYGYPTAA